MSKYPVEIGDDEGVADALNYLLSGPGGLGQNFAGFSSYVPAYLTGNFRIPFSQSTLADLYVPPITVGTITMIDSRTVQVNFSSAQPSPPFALGNGLTCSGMGGGFNDLINDYGTQIGVVICTTTYVIIRLSSEQPLLSPSSGGTIRYYSSGNFFNSTDLDVRVTVTGGTDRVFVSGQLDNTMSYNVLSGPADFEYTVAIRRYKGVVNNDPVNPDYIFDLDGTVATKTTTFSGLIGTGTLPLQETIFTSFVDEPDPGYYRYILEVKFKPTVGDVQIESSLLALRTIATQVVKQ